MTSGDNNSSSLKRAVERLRQAKAAGEQIFDEADFIARAIQQEVIDGQAASVSSRNDRDPERKS